MFLIGNKADLEDSRLIYKESALKLQNDFNFDLFMETSAKTGLNTRALFVEAGKLLYKEYLKYKNKPNQIGEKLKNDVEEDEDINEKKKKRCC